MRRGGVFLGERDLDDLLVAGLQADELLLEAPDELTGAQLEQMVAALAAGEVVALTALALDGALEVDDDEVAALRSGDDSRLSPADKAALEFARKMTQESAAVTDAEFANLVKAFGEKRAASMVLLMAYANFQDRFLICLGTPIEPDGPFPPLDVSFDPGAPASKPNPPRPSSP